MTQFSLKKCKMETFCKILCNKHIFNTKFRLPSNVVKKKCHEKIKGKNNHLQRSDNLIFNAIKNEIDQFQTITNTILN